MVMLSELEGSKPITVIYPIPGLNTFPLSDLNKCLSHDIITKTKEKVTLSTHNEDPL